MRMNEASKREGFMSHLRSLFSEESSDALVLFRAVREAFPEDDDYDFQVMDISIVRSLAVMCTHTCSKHGLPDNVWRSEDLTNLLGGLISTIEDAIEDRRLKPHDGRWFFGNLQIPSQLVSNIQERLGYFS